MKYLLLFILLLIATTLFAKKHHHCSIYQYYGHDSTKKQIVCNKSFDTNGNLIEMNSFRYFKYSTIEGTTVSPIEQDGIHRYFYGNNLLKKQFFVPQSASDTNYEDFIYRNDILIFLIKTTTKKKDSIYNEWTGKYQAEEYGNDTTKYEYNLSGEKVTEIKSGSVEYFAYDNNKRLIYDSIVESYGVRILKYSYNEKGYNILHVDKEHQYDVYKEEYILDNMNLIIEHNDHYQDNRYVEDTKTINEYSDGDIVKSRYFVNNILTTTHLFVYD